MTDREKYEAWFAIEFSSLTSRSGVGFDLARENGYRIWQASRRAAIKDAHSVCLAGVKWSPEPSKWIQFYVNGTCHRLAAEIGALADGDTNNG